MSEEGEDTIIPIESSPPLGSPGSGQSGHGEWLIPTANDMHRYKPVNCCEKRCCGGLQGMACGWPKGTVRAIIAIVLLIVVMGVEGFLVIWLAVQGNDTSAIAVGAAMLAELGAVGGFYFGSRSSKKDDDTIHHQTQEEAQEEAQHQLPS